MTSSIGRRDLLRFGGQKVAEAASRLATAKVPGRTRDWVRPPFALDELNFLLDCTRCDKCIKACPHDVLFTLPARTGLHAAGTPAMDLLHHGCHMCSDWPCVAACEPGALKLPENDGDRPPTAPKLAIAKIDRTACLPYSGPECGACADSCPIPGALDWEGVRPVINQEICTGCARCREACILDPKAIKISAFGPDDKLAADS